jgi:hypothetical protein
MGSPVIRPRAWTARLSDGEVLSPHCPTFHEASTQQTEFLVRRIVKEMLGICVGPWCLEGVYGCKSHSRPVVTGNSVGDADLGKIYLM